MASGGQVSHKGRSDWTACAAHGSVKDWRDANPWQWVCSPKPRLGWTLKTFSNGCACGKERYTLGVRVVTHIHGRWRSVLVVPSNFVSFQFPSVSVHVDVESLLGFFDFLSAAFLCDLKPRSSGRWNLAEPHSWSSAAKTRDNLDTFTITPPSLLTTLRTT